MNVNMQHTVDCRWVFSISVIGLQNLHVGEKISVRSALLLLNMITVDTFHDSLVPFGYCTWQAEGVIKVIDYILYQKNDRLVRPGI